MKNRQSTLVAFLELLKVKHTNDFSNKCFNEHPHKYNLFGLSKMLSDYGVENAGTRKEKTQLRATPTILVNGYKLPDNYKIKDLKYFTEFKI